MRTCGTLAPENLQRKALEAFARNHAAGVAPGAAENPNIGIKAHQWRSDFKCVVVKNLVEVACGGGLAHSYKLLFVLLYP